MKTILGDQSPWNGGLLRAQALRKSGIDFLYQQHDGDSPGVVTGGPTGAARGNPPYFSLACRLPMSPLASTVAQESVLGACRRGASTKPVAYLNYKGTKTIRGSAHEVSGVIAQMFQFEREHLCAVSGSAVPQVSSSDEALQLHAQGIVVNSLMDMFHETPPLLFGRLGPEYFWGIDEYFNRMPYVPRSDWYAIIPKGPALLLEFAARGLRFGLTNCPYQNEVVKLRDQSLRGMQVNVLKISFRWNADFLGEHTNIGKAWRKKEKPDFSNVIDYWRTRPTSMGVLAFGGELHPTFEECVW